MNFRDELNNAMKTPQQVADERKSESIEKGKNYAYSHYAQLKEEFISKAQAAEYTINNGKRIINVEIEVWLECAKYEHTTTRAGYGTIYREGLKCVFDDETLYKTYIQNLNSLCSQDGIKAKLWGVVDVKPLPNFRWTNKYNGRRYYEVPGKAPGSEIQDFDYMKSYASLVLKATIELDQDMPKSYEWRETFRNVVDYGVYPDDYETQEEFLEAYNIAENEHWKKKEEQHQADVERMKRQMSETPEQREQRLKEEDLKDTQEYIYCGVNVGEHEFVYHYITNDDSIKEGDKVVVPFGFKSEGKVAIVVSVGKYLRCNAPYPFAKTKRIIKKL